MYNEDETKEQLLTELEKLRQQVASLQAKEAEYQNLAATLRLREQEVDALLGIPPQPVIARFDRDLRHTYVNTAVQLATGIPPEAYIGKTSGEMGMKEPTLSRWENTLRTLFHTGAAETIEHSVSAGGPKRAFPSPPFPQ